MEIGKALELAGQTKICTVATIQPDGRPHLSIVTAVVIDERLWISATQTRVKTRNLRRDPRCTLLFGVRPWTAIEGTARILDGDGVGDKLRRYYREAAGEHPDWEDYDRAMIRDQRLIIEVEPQHAYGFAG